MCMNLEGNRAVKAITEGMRGRAGGGATKLDAMVVQCLEWKVVANVYARFPLDKNETRWYRVFGYLGIVRRAPEEEERELRIRHGNVISAQPVYLYNCPHFEAASSKCP